MIMELIEMIIESILALTVWIIFIGMLIIPGYQVFTGNITIMTLILPCFSVGMIGCLLFFTGKLNKIHFNTKISEVRE